MKKNIPNFLSNSSLEVSNSIYKDDILIVGDMDEVLNVKNQYLLTTYQFSNEPNKFFVKSENPFKNFINKGTKLAYTKIFTQEETDNYTDLRYYPLIDIKIKGSGLRDILKKNKHASTGIICVHDFTNIHRRDFDMYDNYYKFIKKKNFVKSIKISSSKICFFPVSNDLKKNPFIKYQDYQKFKKFEEYNKDEILLFEKELKSIKNKKNKKKGIGNIVKFEVDNGTYNIYNSEYKNDLLIFILKK